MEFDHKQNFIHFIKEKGVAGNILSWLHRSGKGSLNQYLDRTDPFLYIDALGDWTSSPEGSTFWRNLHETWELIHNGRVVIKPEFPTLKSIW